MYNSQPLQYFLYEGSDSANQNNGKLGVFYRNMDGVTPLNIVILINPKRRSKQPRFTFNFYNQNSQDLKTSLHHFETTCIYKETTDGGIRLDGIII